MLNPKESEFIRKLSEQEICELREAFNIFDDNSDGNINKNKLHLLLLSLKQKPTENDYKNVLGSLGLDKKKKINFEQFLLIFAKLTQNTKINEERYLKKLFDNMDRNKNGRISIHEIRYIVRNSNENISEEEIELLIKEVDTDGDGLISFDEFLVFMKS